MTNSYGLSISSPNEEVFSSGLFSCVEYCKASADSPDFFETVESEAVMLKRLSEKYNVRIRSFHLPFGESEKYFSFEPSSLDAQKRKNTFDYTKKLINILSDCGIEYLVIHGSLRVDPKDRQARLDAFVLYISELCDYCKPFGIKVAVETLKPRCIGNGLKEHLYIMEHANKDNLGICFDSNHLLEEDNIEFLKNAGQYVITTHLSDFDGIDERHWYPGRGINDWNRIVDILTEKGYNAPWVFEVSFPDGHATSNECKTLISEWENITKK